MPVNSERMLISSVIRERDIQTVIKLGVTDDMFYTCSEEWKWINRYYTKTRKLPSKTAFTHHFPDFVIKAANDVAYFSEEVRKAHTRKMLTASITETAELITTGKITDAVDCIQSAVVKISADMNVGQDSDLFGDWEDMFAEVKARKEEFDETGSAGIPTGWETFDDRSGGIGRGQLCVVAARLSEGKSWTLMRMATAAMMGNHKVHYASLEMSKAEVGMRIHNMLSGTIGKQVFQASALDQGHGFDLHQYKAFVRDLKRNFQGSFTISDRGRIGIAEIAAQIEQHKPDAYYLDYLTLVKMKGDGGHQDIGDLVKELKNLAKEYRLAMIVASQLNRGAAIGNTPAGAETISGSDQVGHHADKIITLKKQTETVTQFKLPKNRQGMAGYSWWSHLDTKRGVFEEVSKNDAEKFMEHDRSIADLGDVRRSIRKSS